MLLTCNSERGEEDCASCSRGDEDDEGEQKTGERGGSETGGGEEKERTLPFGEPNSIYSITLPSGLSTRMSGMDVFSPLSADTWSLSILGLVGLWSLSRSSRLLDMKL